MDKHDPDNLDDDIVYLLAEELIERPVLSDACDEIGVSILAVRRAMRRDDKFAEIIQEAENAGNDKLEARLYERAMGEDEKVVMYNGRAVQRINENGETETLKERQQSDRALFEMVKGRLRDRYGDKSEVNIKSGTGVLAIPVMESKAAFEEMLKKISEEAEQENAEFEKPDLDAAAG